MPCRVSTGHFLVRNKPWFIVGRSSKSKLVRSRRLNTIDLEEQTAPWDTSWLKCDLQHKGHAALPKSGDISLKSPRKAFLNHGVSIDNRGQLTVNSRTHAEKECRTALILSAASTHLTKADFTRLLPENDSLGEHGFEGSFDPVLDVKSPKLIERSKLQSRAAMPRHFKDFHIGSYCSGHLISLPPTSRI